MVNRFAVAVLSLIAALLSFSSLDATVLTIDERLHARVASYYNLLQRPTDAAPKDLWSFLGKRMREEQTSADKYQRELIKLYSGLKLDGAVTYKPGPSIPGKKTWTAYLDVQIKEVPDSDWIKLQHVTNWVLESAVEGHSPDWFLYREEFFPRSANTVSRQ